MRTERAGGGGGGQGRESKTSGRGVLYISQAHVPPPIPTNASYHLGHDPERKRVSKCEEHNAESQRKPPCNSVFMLKCGERWSVIGPSTHNDQCKLPP